MAMRKRAKKAAGRWRGVAGAIFAAAALISCQMSDLADAALDPDDTPPPAGDPFWAKLGVNFHLYEASPIGDLAAQLADARGLGFTSLRTSAYWAEGTVESWERFFAAAGGFDVLVVFNTLEPWDCSTSIVDAFIVPFVERFDARQIAGYEILNEFEATGCSTEAYLALFDLAEARLAPLTAKPISPSSTRPMTQDFPDNLNINQAIVRSGMVGAGNFLSMHVYGTQFEKYLFITPFLASEVDVPIWVTEFGETDPNDQLAYLGTIANFMEDEIRPSRYYWYDYFETGGAYGLVQWDGSGRIESDLYRYLRDNPVLPGRTG